MKRVFVKQDSLALRALRKANVPSFVVERIVGKEVLINDQFETVVDWLGKDTAWSLPPDAIKMIAE